MGETPSRICGAGFSHVWAGLLVVPVGGGFLLLLLVASRVFRAPRGLFGPGCFVCPWAAARPRAVRAASCCLLPRQISGRRAACPPARRPRRELRSARRLEARPGPAGLAAASNRSGVSVCCLARPRHRPRAPQPGPAAAHGHRSQDFRSLRHPTGSDGGLAALGAVCRRVVGVSRF